MPILTHPTEKICSAKICPLKVMNYFPDIKSAVLIQKGEGDLSRTNYSNILSVAVIRFFLLLLCLMECVPFTALNKAKDNLTALESSWSREVMLEAAKIRSYALVLNLVISELNRYSVEVKYHWKCYQRFTCKLRLELLSKKDQSKYSYKIKETMINYLQN